MSEQKHWGDFQIIELSYVMGNITNTTYQKLKLRNNFTVFDNGVLILNLMPATHFQKKFCLWQQKTCKAVKQKTAGGRSHND